MPRWPFTDDDLRAMYVGGHHDLLTREADDPPATRTIVWFVVLAYAFAWAWWLPLAISGTVVGPGQGWPTHLIGLLGPAFAAIIVTGFSDGRAGLRDLWARIVGWRVGWVWYAVIAATGALAAVALLTKPSLGAGDIVLYSGAPSAGLAVVVYVLVVNGFGEEIGWRGFLADRLLRRTSRGKTALIVWPIWALWHLPLFWVVATFRTSGSAARSAGLSGSASAPSSSRGCTTQPTVRSWSSRSGIPPTTSRPPPRRAAAPPRRLPPRR